MIRPLIIICAAACLILSTSAAFSDDKAPASIEPAYAGCFDALPACPAIVPCLRIQGKVLDFTQNHGRDRRIYSPSLCDKRDLYVYLPPGYCPEKQYPLMIVLHGILQDERAFLDWVVKPLDDAIAKGCLPPMIVAAPDGSFTGDPNPWDAGSFYINGPRGKFQSWIEDDLWHFLTCNFSIRPEANAHVMAGASMGGVGAFCIGLKHPERFGRLVGLMPALNLRWMDQSGNYMAPFDPNNWGWRNGVNDPNEVIGKFGPLKVHVKDILIPAFGRGNSAIILASENNPIEMIDRMKVKPGQVDMLVTMAGKDNFNLEAGAQSFVYLAERRGIHVDTFTIPNGGHNVSTAQKMIPTVFDWINAKLAQFNQ
ncbi:MAG TPA: alpha/beta hydrolase-fold protein [Gemmatales bacterium]|nr:alpha/beta hydrolase-fold protein [Gemmatales bacterium]